MPAKLASRPASSAVEDYLERILDLINTKGYARVVDIARSLGISQASVTNMVQRMDAEGLLKYEKYRGLVLTTAGRNARAEHHAPAPVADRFSQARSASTTPRSITMSRAWSNSHQPADAAGDRGADRAASNASPRCWRESAPRFPRVDLGGPFPAESTAHEYPLSLSCPRSPSSSPVARPWK